MALLSFISPHHHTDQEPMNQKLSLAAANVLCFAVRYALQRPSTTAADSVTSEVIRLWPALEPWQRKQVLSEVEGCYTAGVHPDCWKQVLALEIESDTLPF